MKDVFDWDEIRGKFGEQKTRDILIGAAFKQYIDGNCGFEEKSGNELNDLFDMFRASWIICEHMVGGS